MKQLLELAKLLLETDSNFIISTNSPYMLQALRVESEDEDVERWFKTEASFINMKNNTVKNVTDDLNVPFREFSKPLEDLVWS